MPPLRLQRPVPFRGGGFVARGGGEGGGVPSHLAGPHEGGSEQLQKQGHDHYEEAEAKVGRGAVREVAVTHPAAEPRVLLAEGAAAPVLVAQREAFRGRQREVAMPVDPRHRRAAAARGDGVGHTNA